MAHLIKYVVGIDISKDKFDVCMMSLDTQLVQKIKGSRKFSNSPMGFNEFHVWIQKFCKEPIPVQMLMEATGVYHECLAIWLTEKEYTVFVVVPNKARKYLQSLGHKSKNDKIDATGLACMCLQNKFEPWKPISKFYYELRLLTRHYQSMQEMKTAINNQLHSLNHSGYNSEEVIKQLVETIQFIEKQVDECRHQIALHLRKDEEIDKKVKQILPIKGIDILTIATVIAETNGFELFSNIRQLASYSGYDVIENQSGTHVGRTKISKKGNSRIRRILHMPSLNVVKWNEPMFKNLYARVYERTKCKMKGYVAVQKKLLEIIYTLWKRDKIYNKTYYSAVISGNTDSRVLFPVSRNNIKGRSKKVVLLEDSTTQNEHRYNKSSEVLFPVV